MFVQIRMVCRNTRLGTGIDVWDFLVPVIAVFTKYDQFRRNLVFRLEDMGRDPGTELEDEAESTFREHYLNGLRGSPPFVRLESENFVVNYHELC
jgi:hypothetical protein